MQLVKVAPLSDDDKLTLVRWIDIGCPIDRDAERGWILDEGRPTLTLAYPQPGANSRLDRIVIGMHDYGTGLDMATFKVTADFAIDGVKAGENLAPSSKSTAPGVWEFRLANPPASRPHAKLQVEVRDRQGNPNRACGFSVSEVRTHYIALMIGVFRCLSPAADSGGAQIVALQAAAVYNMSSGSST